MSILFELAEKYNTDKQLKDHNYILMYERLMEEKRVTTNKMLEIGFGEGGSAKMWMDYFPNAEIYCVEYFDKEHEEVWHSPSVDLPELNMIKGDSTNAETWLEIPNNFDFIIDDGSHHPDDQISTFLLGFSHLKSKGLYFIEDTHCNFEVKYTGGQDIIYKWVFDYIIQQQTPGKNYNGNFYQFRNAMPNIVKDIYSYRFYKSVIVFEKA